MTKEKRSCTKYESNFGGEHVRAQQDSQMQSHPNALLLVTLLLHNFKEKLKISTPFYPLFFS
jgi:hypothetical protein